MKEIHIWGVKQNNLKNIEVKIPVGQLTVICGPSGSGKSSLAFETLFAEGQRRFIESMSNYARQFLNKAPKPDIEGINNIPPSISIEQKNTIKSSRSTVGTATELTDYLRLLFEKVGKSFCPTHEILTQKFSVTEAADVIIDRFQGQRGYLLIEIDEVGRVAEGKKLHSLLLQDGYLRIMIPHQSVDNSVDIDKEVSLASKKKKGSKKSKKNEAESVIPVVQNISVDQIKDLQKGILLEKLGQIIEISDPAIIKKGLPKEKFYLVIDRMSFQADERGRIADSVSQAYEASLKYNTHLTAKRAFVLTTEGEKIQFSDELCCSICGFQPPPLNSRLFSFNSPIGACPTCKGFGNVLEVDENKVIPNPAMSIAQGALSPFWMPSASYEKKQLLAYCKKQNIDVHEPWQSLPKQHRDLIWNGNKEFFGVKGLFEYLDQIKYKMHVRVFIARFRSAFECPDCHGSRLRKEVNHVLINGKNINDLTQMTIEVLQAFFKTIQLSPNELEISGEVFKQIKSRLDFLLRVGVNYLTLARETRTLSGGEYQRLLLANQLGMGLSQVLYVLDEPTVGLHPRDNDRLISILKELKELGNTLVIVEHDHDVIENSEHIIEMGPGSGYLGGQVIYSGKIKDFYQFKDSNTVPYLQNAKKHSSIVNKKELTNRPVDKDQYRYKIQMYGAKGHNLKNIDVTIPLNRLVTVTGVSGSGKSTLITKTLYPALARSLGLEFLPSQELKSIEGVDNIKNVILIDQSPIGKSARSSPITYLKAFDAIRNLMAATPEAKSRGYTPGTFSLNVDGGRCPACKGTGYEEIDMMFMDNVVIPCDVCDGKKYRDEILEIDFKGKNVSQILSMTVREAMDFFVAHPNIRKPLSVLKEVGLDYLQLGQPANSLSGGESQRLKIAKELAQVQQKATLYILDEPTTGLHFREVKLLLEVLNKLIEAGGSIVVVEHNLDVIYGSDYVIDLGPDAGKKGGQLVVCGTPQDVMNCKKSLTGQYLKKYVEAKS